VATNDAEKQQSCASESDSHSTSAGAAEATTTATTHPAAAASPPESVTHSESSTAQETDEDDAELKRFRGHFGPDGRWISPSLDTIVRGRYTKQALNDNFCLPDLLLFCRTRGIPGRKKPEIIRNILLYLDGKDFSGRRLQQPSHSSARHNYKGAYSAKSSASPAVRRPLPMEGSPELPSAVPQTVSVDITQRQQLDLAFCDSSTGPDVESPVHSGALSNTSLVPLKHIDLCVTTPVDADLSASSAASPFKAEPSPPHEPTDKQPANVKVVETATILPEASISCDNALPVAAPASTSPTPSSTAVL